MAYNNQLYIFGGATCNSQGDIKVYNPRRYTWSIVESKSAIPNRIGHVGTMYNGFLIIFGG